MMDCRPIHAHNDDEFDHNEFDDQQTGVVTRIKPKLAEPPLYKVLMLNDDYTPMDFVVHALQNYFNKTHEEAEEIMLAVHHNGVGICGVFTRDIADTKAQLVVDLARANGHPLMCQIERD